MNGQQIIDALFEASPQSISRADLARLTGLSKPTASALVGELESSGLIRHDTTAKTTGVGRPGRLYQLVPEAGIVIGADIGATKIIVGLADLLGNVVAEQEIESGPDAETALARMAAVAHEMLGGNKAGAACVGVPGIYRPEQDRVERALNLPGFDNLALKARLEHLMGVEVQVDNDVNLAALGEAANMPEDNKPTDFAAISVGTGIGMGLVIDGRLYRGGTGAAGEIGSLVLSGDPEDPTSVETLEDRASAPAIRKLFGRAVKEGWPTSLASDVDVPDLLAAASEDQAAALVLATAADAMVMALAHLCFLVDPQRVVFGGGVGANPVFVQAVRAGLERRRLESIEVEASTLGRRATFLGAVSCALAVLHESLVAINLGSRR